MKLQDVRSGLNSWVPEKTRIVLGTFFDLTDWGTDLALTLTLAKTAASVSSSLSTQQGDLPIECFGEGFDEIFCLDGGIQDLSTLCIVAFALGTLGSTWRCATQSSSQWRLSLLTALPFPPRSDRNALPPKEGTPPAAPLRPRADTLRPIPRGIQQAHRGPPGATR